MGAWGIKALERDEGLDVLDILKNEYVPEHPVMDLGEMIELMKEEVMLGSDFSQIDFLFDNTAMALAELYFQWKDNGKLDYDLKKLYGIKSPVSQHPKKHLLSCCGSSPTSKTRCRTRTASVRLWIFGRTRIAERSLLRGWNT